MPVTNHVEMDYQPIWSPDGKWIAFATNRNGSSDIYAVPADGGQSRRLTYHSGNELPTDWTPDGKKIIFATTRDDSHNGLFTVNVQTLANDNLTLDKSALGGAVYSPDGSKIAFTRIGFPWFRPRYHGTGASQLWMMEVAGGRRTKLRDNLAQHLWPQFSPDGKSIYCVTVSEVTPSSSYLGKPNPKNVDNSKRTPNLYQISLDGSAKQITEFVGGGVRWPSVAKKEGSVVFEYEGDIYVAKPGSKPSKIDVTATIDDKVTAEERLILTTGVEQAALSSAGDSAAFTIRGEIWTVPTKKSKGPNSDDAVQMTTWEGLDTDAIFSPDGKSLFFTSDREGSQRLYRMDVATKATLPVSAFGNEVTNLSISPDKKLLGYMMTGPQGGIYAVSFDGGDSKRLVPLPKSGTQGLDSYAWSPDMHWMAYSKSVAGTVINASAPVNLYIYDLQTNSDHRVTHLNAQHDTPTWSPDGKYLFYKSNSEGSGLYVLPLNSEKARTAELDLKYEKPTAAVKVDIDFEDIESRSRKLISQPVDNSIAIDANNGNILFLSAGDIWQASYSGDELRKLTATTGIGGFDLSGDGNSLFFIRAGAMNTLSLRQPGNPTTEIKFRADWTRDLRKERHAAFAQFWRAYNRNFYDANFHGRDWTSIRGRYERLLPSIGHRNEFSTLLNMMVGELESSHSEVGPSAGNPRPQTSAHLGFTIDYSYSGPGIRIKDVPKRSPGSYEKTRLSPGEVVLQINGKDVKANEALWRDVLNEEGGRDLLLSVSKNGDKAGVRTVKYRALSAAEWTDLIYRNRIDARRKYVEAKSDGKLTYMHISGMGNNNFQTFNKEAWEFVQGKKGAIIDVRNNGGGNISDMLIDEIERIPHSYVVARDGEVGLAPANSWNMPTAVLMGETSFSNAEMFPAAMKARKLATIVGVPTPGYVIWTYGLPLIDGTSARMPSSGQYRLDGSPLEDMGETPDYEVAWTNEDYFAGKDPQLDKAIEVLMAKIK